LLLKVIENLSIISKHYSQITAPQENNSQEEYKWLTKFQRGGNIATFLPLLIAARIKYYDEKKISKKDYIELLENIEKFAYRVFLVREKRSSTALSTFYKWSYQLYNDYEKCKISEISKWILETINYYANENEFRQWLENPSNWYDSRALKYTLYEYELSLLETEGNYVKPNLDWTSISNSTIEHILPQTPNEKNSQWLQTWQEKDINMYLHDISNIVLTFDNSHYLNFDYTRKRGAPGISPSYSNSDIRQERKIAAFKNWTVKECQTRREDLRKWIISRWGIN
jgi:hypothetical protein